MSDYLKARAAYRNAAHGIGQPVRSDEMRRELSENQRRHFAGKNIMTDEKIGFAILAGGLVAVEIGFGQFMKSHLGAASCYAIGEAWERYGTALDFDLSQCFHTPEALAAYLGAIDACSDPAELAAMAAAADIAA